MKPHMIEAINAKLDEMAKEISQCDNYNRLDAALRLACKAIEVGCSRQHAFRAIAEKLGVKP
jgi:hypothetical protein